MSTPARTPAAGLPGPVWPARPAPPLAQGRADAGAPVAPGERASRNGAAAAPAPTAPARPAAAPAPSPVVADHVPADVPPEERELDPRSIARASLAAGRNRSLWWTLTGIATAVGATYVWDAVVGTGVLVVLLLVYAVVRAVGRPPGPAAVTVRSKPLDVAVLVLAAVALAVLASVLPAA
ncbi:hypothetical protein [Cellulomonas wangsupingiae]|uniref:DUF3017 domain-containing protein n=1 Tax=Cellulomonas wangsupingiae TaxID=2968085 RepID=A0ABY5K2Q7_9CELL|nr:hypothetical protein [Cellulomonas wangsupingiae]MCC2335849.1 hypothetical protein [Cellulomonas wangsupingiae]UUI64074.1 hypothetical protein NP075_13175 [Cellulomonas wangsupingiae]